MNKKQISIILFLAFGLTTLGQAQSVKRQTIGSYASNGYVDNVSVHQTAGQPYGTSTYYDNKIGIRPGFQQPESFRIIESQNKLQLGIYPNPATFSFSIESKEKIGQSHLHITDMNGKVIYDATYQDFSHTTINCNDWSNGAYFISLKDNENSSLYSSKLIITK